MARRPVAYIRKSVVKKGKRMLSPQVQQEHVEELAERNGDSGLLVFGDIGRSGRRKTKRPDYLRILEMLRANEVSAIYAYNLARLCRSTKDWAELAELCAERKVAVRLVLDGDQSLHTATGRMTATVLAGVAQMTSDLASEHARDTIAAKLAKGEHHGARPYGAYADLVHHQDDDGTTYWTGGESVDAVADAFAAAGSYHGAARLLKDWGTPTRRGGPWRTTSVKLVLERSRPNLVPPGQVQRAKSAPKFWFARLLRCPCGHTLTGVRQSGTGNIRYVCTQAFDGSDHSTWPKSVSEPNLLAWMQAEAGRMQMPSQVELEGDQTAAAGLDDRREKLLRQHEMGAISDGELTERLAVVEEEREQLRSTAVVRDMPQRIEWDGWLPEDVNHVLRQLWHAVEMGDDQRPVRAVWRVPALRAR